MVGIAEISAGLSSLKALKDIVQGLDAARNVVITNDLKIAFQSHILDAQQALLSAQQEQSTVAATIGRLEQEIVRLKDWAAERDRYELVEADRGAFAYMLKEGMRGTEPAHWLCTSCYDGGKKSIMQPQGKINGMPDKITFSCPVCRNAMAVHWRARPHYKGEDA